MKRKALASVLTAAMALALFTGCGNEGNEGSGEGSSTPGGSTGENSEVTDVALKVWCPQNQVDSGIMEEQQTAFAAEHPEWNITWTTEIVGEDNCKTEILKDVDAAADRTGGYRSNRTAWRRSGGYGEGHELGGGPGNGHGGGCHICHSFHP